MKGESMKARLKMPDKKTRVSRIKSELDAAFERFYRVQEEIASSNDGGVYSQVPLWREWSGLAAKITNLVEQAATIEREEGEDL